MARPEKPIKSSFETGPAHVRALVDCYSGDKQLLQQAIKDLERRISHKKQQLEIEKEVLKQLNERLSDLDNLPD